MPRSMLAGSDSLVEQPRAGTCSFEDAVAEVGDAVGFTHAGEIGADRVVVSFAAGDWPRQTELLAEARALLD
jgi:hypothetical protein